jgi:probable HAF family extracellular repeat protein
MSDLGSLGGTLQTAFATDINDAGVVVGYSTSAAADNNDRGFVWTQADGMRELPAVPPSPRSRAFGINSSGVAVGASYTDIGRATRWQPDRTPTDLSPFGLAGAEPMAINDAGSIAGFSRLASGITAFVFTPGTPVVFLGTLGGSSSSATDINNAGAVVGYSHTAGGAQHAFLWTSSSGMRDLGTLGGGSSAANAINDAGWIVGSSTRADGSVRLALWRPNRAPTVDAGGPYTAKNKHTVFTFDASGSSDPDGDALTYEWDFGDGSAVATGATVQHEYGEKGEFTVTLTVRDSFGATTVTTIPVIVGNPKKKG